jgi:Flp pilus assembly protein TadD
LPYHFAQREAARLNHAADAARADLPIGLECSVYHQRAGFAQLMRREPAAAEGEFRQALALNADNERALYGLGLSLLKQGRLVEARQELERARALDHDDAQVHMALGQAAEALGCEREAMARYREASLLQPDNPAPALYIADLREARNELGRSVYELNDSLKRMPDSRYVRLRRDDQLSYRLRSPM